MAETILDLTGNVIVADEFRGTITGGLPDASATVKGVVKQGVGVPDIVPDADGTTAGTALNALLASLRAAGVIA